MSNTKQDRARVSGDQNHEVKYEAGKTGASMSEVKHAVKSEGNSRKAVEEARQEVRMHIKLNSDDMAS